MASAQVCRSFQNGHVNQFETIVRQIMRQARRLVFTCMSCLILSRMRKLG